MDEGRFGLRGWLRRRWCPRGERPPWVYADAYEWRWLDAAVEPLHGDSFFLLLPRVDTPCLQLFLDHLGAHVPDRRVGVVLDGSGAHQARELRWPANLVPLPLPPYSPELNPAEQVFRHLRACLANRIFADVAELEEAIADALRTFWDAPQALRQLVGYPWWIEAARQIRPNAS